MWQNEQMRKLLGQTHRTVRGKGESSVFKYLCVHDTFNNVSVQYYFQHCAHKMLRIKISLVLTVDWIETFEDEMFPFFIPQWGHLNIRASQWTESIRVFKSKAELIYTILSSCSPFDISSTKQLIYKSQIMIYEWFVYFYCLSASRIFTGLI